MPFPMNNLTIHKKKEYKQLTLLTLWAHLANKEMKLQQSRQTQQIRLLIELGSSELSFHRNNIIK